MWLLLLACASSRCVATGCDWTDCAVRDAWCIEGDVVSDDQLAICEDGCSCPAEALGWDATRGCITEDECRASTD